MAYDALFQPLTVGNLTLANRIVMAPMTRGFSPGGIPTADVAAYYARRAAAEVGLIVTEGTVIERPVSKNSARIPDFFGDALPAWRDVVDAVHHAGGKIAPQIWHVGGSPGSIPDWETLDLDTPSGHTKPGTVAARPMSDSAIADTIEAYGRAALEAVQMGSDAVEVHGAHGYLLDQFFWSLTNQRDDRWGGASIADRVRFAAEVVKIVRRNMPDGLPLIFRLSQWKIGAYDARVVDTPQTFAQWLEPLADAGVDIFHCSQRRIWEPEFEGSDLNLAGWAKKLTGKTTISVGSVGLDGVFAIEGFARTTAQPADIDKIVERLERGEFDLVAVGRALLADPEWAAKVRSGRFDQLEPFEAEKLRTLY